LLLIANESDRTLRTVNYIAILIKASSRDDVRAILAVRLLEQAVRVIVLHNVTDNWRLPVMDTFFLNVKGQGTGRAQVDIQAHKKLIKQQREKAKLTYPSDDSVLVMFGAIADSIAVKRVGEFDEWRISAFGNPDSEQGGRDPAVVMIVVPHEAVMGYHVVPSEGYSMTCGGLGTALIEPDEAGFLILTRYTGSQEDSEFNGGFSVSSDLQVSQVLVEYNDDAPGGGNRPVGRVAAINIASIGGTSDLQLEGDFYIARLALEGDGGRQLSVKSSVRFSRSITPGVRHQLPLEGVELTFELNGAVWDTHTFGRFGYAVTDGVMYVAWEFSLVSDDPLLAGSVVCEAFIPMGE
jgi:hypothetical protein